MVTRIDKYKWDVFEDEYKDQYEYALLVFVSKRNRRYDSIVLSLVDLTPEIDIPILIADSDDLSDLKRRYGVRTNPTFILLNGVDLEKKIRMHSEDAISDVLDELVDYMEENPMDDDDDEDYDDEDDEDDDY